MRICRQPFRHSLAVAAAIVFVLFPTTPGRANAQPEVIPEASGAPVWAMHAPSPPTGDHTVSAARSFSPPAPDLPAAGPVPPFQRGVASWYGLKFHGRLTANGEIYDMNAPTAAHQTLPFDTVVRVTNRETGRSTLVRINDRGPFVDNRIIDLSMYAAEQIGMLHTGIAPVFLDIVVEAPIPDAYRIQLGAYRDRSNAARAVALLERAGFMPTTETAGEVTRVVLLDVSPGELDATLDGVASLGYAEPLVRADRPPRR